MWRYLVDREKEETQRSDEHGKKRSFSESTCCGDSISIPEGSSRMRHNKVSTSKGLRDRRVRLSAPTAIELFDIQDRLGYDQPSKAIDWLILNARSAIEAIVLVSQAPQDLYRFGLRDPSPDFGFSQQLIDSDENQLLYPRGTLQSTSFLSLLEFTNPLICVPADSDALSAQGFPSGGFVRF